MSERRLLLVCSPSDYRWGAGWEPVHYSTRIDPGAAPGDSLRYWVQWLYTSNPRVLELPPTYLDSRIKKGLTTPDNNRREAETDDHGEGYPQTADGPNVYTPLTVPKGLFTLSLYDFNKDDHDWGGNSARDYRLSVRAHPAQSLEDVSGFNEQPELAHGRIRDFWGGVWKRFLVRGPLTLTVQVNRNNSHNTILPAVMLDLVDETPPPYFGTVDQWEEAQTQKEKQWQQVRALGGLLPFTPATTETEAANRLADALETAQTANSSWWAVDSRRFYAPLLRWYAQATGEPQAHPHAKSLRHMATCYYELSQYGAWEKLQRDTGLNTARDIEHALSWDGVSSCSGLGYMLVTSSSSAEVARAKNARLLPHDQNTAKGVHYVDQP